jgi:outer membrane receptor protein involved in Fe transport
VGELIVKNSFNDTLMLRILAATSLACAASANVHAADQAAAAADAAASNSQGLEEVVVTASGKDKTQLNSAVSVTSVNAKLIEDFHPSSESEVFRMIPGIQVAGTAGPGGNSNIAVRGLPVATGGSPFVQIQEDGLPTVLFGDIQFGNNDYWTHYDASVARVEAVRGGSATTYASQAPGAVINYISQTGKEEGGYVQLNKGLGYDETKVDFRYGGRINDTTYYHIGGYFKTGRGPLHADFNVSESAQVKANLTKELDGGKGYIRFLVKVADTQEPNYTGSPAYANVSGNSVSGISPYPGFDGRTNSNYSIYNQDFLIVNRDGVLERTKMDGITTKAQAFGNQFHYDFDGGVTVDNNLRWTKMSGGFASPFFNVAHSQNTNAIPVAFSQYNACNIVAAQKAAGVADKDLYSTNGVIGSCVNGQVVGAIKYASGLNAGSAFTGQYLDNNVNVRTNVRDVGSFANDFGLSGKFELANIGKVTARGGWFFMNQKIAEDWHVNVSTREISGHNPSQLDLYSVSGAKLTDSGIAGFNNNWGDCCARDVDLAYADSAPYISLDLDANRFGVDGSVRRDSVKASGWTFKGGTTFNTTVNGVAIPTMLANGPGEVLNYTESYNSWTVGGLFKATPDMSVFVRASQGGRFNGDRQTVSGKINADGSLTQAGKTAAVDFVNQYELGIKDRGSLFGGHYTAEFTLLNGDFKQSTYELTATKCPGGKGGCVIDAKYKSYGAEFYGTYGIGAFSFVANATYSHAQKEGSGATSFVRADGIPDLIYTLSSEYAFSHWISAGLTATGQTSEVDGAGNTYPGDTTVGATIKFYPVDKLELGLSAYNLFDTFALRGNGGISDSSVTPTLIGGAPALGRTVTASVRFSF